MTRPWVHMNICPATTQEAVREWDSFFKIKEGENYNHRNTYKYFEDYNLSLTLRLGQIAILGKPPSNRQSTNPSSPVQDHMHACQDGRGQRVFDRDNRDYLPNFRSISFWISVMVAPWACIRDANCASSIQIPHVTAWLSTKQLSKFLWRKFSRHRQ